MTRAAAHENLGIICERDISGKFCFYTTPFCGLVAEDELLAATDSLRALVFAERKKRA